MPHQDVVISIHTDRGHFGEISTLFDEPHNTSFMALEYSNLLSINREPLLDILEQWPDLQQKIRTLSRVSGVSAVS